MIMGVPQNIFYKFFKPHLLQCLISANSGYYTTEKKQNINAKRRIIMKFKNLIAKSAIAYLLLLTSSAAMAAGSVLEFWAELRLSTALLS